MQAVAGVAYDRDDLLDRRWVGGVSTALVARRAPGVNPGSVAGDRGRPAASNSTCDMRDLLGIVEAQNVAPAKSDITGPSLTATHGKQEPRPRRRPAICRDRGIERRPGGVRPCDNQGSLELGGGPEEREHQGPLEPEVFRVSSSFQRRPQCTAARGLGT